MVLTAKTTKRLLKATAFLFISMNIVAGFHAYKFTHFANSDVNAKQVDFPVLLLYGEKDKEVSREEIDAIYQNLTNKKTLKTYPDAGHDNYLKQYKEAWTRDVSAFLLAN
jgi:uncharacterized protein